MVGYLDYRNPIDSWSVGCDKEEEEKDEEEERKEGEGEKGETGRHRERNQSPIIPLKDTHPVT